MKNHSYLHWVIVIVFSIVACISVALYVLQFGALGMSVRQEDWAHFGTYISGTVGVAAVISTLAALIITVVQQKSLLKQQEGLLKQQEIQIEMQDKHQKKLEAYSKAEKFFPVLLDACKKDINIPVEEKLRRMGFSVNSSEYVNPSMYFQDFFHDRSLPPSFISIERPYFSSLWGGFMVKWYRMAKLMAECIEDADELLDYFREELGEQEVMLRCVLLYYKGVKYDEACRLLSIFRYPTSYKGMDEVESKWEEVGDRG